jgi:hypothetical protein
MQDRNAAGRSGDSLRYGANVPVGIAQDRAGRTVRSNECQKLVASILRDEYGIAEIVVSL